MTRKRYLIFPFLVSLALMAGTARADEPVTSPPEQRTASSGIGGGAVALAVAVGAGVGAVGALVASEALLTVGAGTVVAIYVGHLLLEAVIVGGAVYSWPESEDAAEPGSRPQFEARQTPGAARLRLVASR